MPSSVRTGRNGRAILTIRGGGKVIVPGSEPQDRRGSFKNINRNIPRARARERG